MAFDWLNHKQLMIVKGIQKTPADGNSAEAGLTVFNLMSGGAVNLSDWSPNLPSIKNGGVWADSPIADGRTLLAASQSNVVEKMTINISDVASAEVMRQLSALNQIASDCNDFWQAAEQIDPVWLAWWAGCGVGPQYALIYNIEIAPTYRASDKPTIEVNLTIEREPAWRGVPPGANPKQWAYYVNSSHAQFNSGTAQLYSGSDHLWMENIFNRQELQLDYVTPITKNYIDIPGTLIPGDAPALVLLDMVDRSSSVTLVSDFYVAKSTKPIVESSHTPVKSFKTLSLLNAGDAVISAGTKVNSADGVISNGSITLQYYVDVTFTANPQTRTITWGNSTTLIKNLDVNTLRGRYAFFLRHKQNGGAKTDTTCQLTIIEGAGVNGTVQMLQSIALDAQQITCLVGALSGGTYGLMYLGTATLPLNHKALSGVEGLGLKIITDTELSTQFVLSVTRSAGASDLRVLDLVLLPLDEGLIYMQTPDDPPGRVPADAGDKWHVVYDNTGYIGHGDVNESAALFYEKAAGVKGTGFNLPLYGSGIMLSPRVNNRLFFLTGRNNATAAAWASQQDTDPVIRLNIVPRWYGIRDV